MVVKTPLAAYNMILGRPLLNDMRVVVSSCYLLMKFPTLAGWDRFKGIKIRHALTMCHPQKGKRVKKFYPLLRQATKGHTLRRRQSATINNLEEKTGSKIQTHSRETMLKIEKLNCLKLCMIRTFRDQR